MKRSPLKRKTPLKHGPWNKKETPKKPRKAMRRIAPRRAKENASYAYLKKTWRALPKNHYCKVLCADLGVETPALPYPHHIRGRRGLMLLDVRFWLPVCFHCHNWIEDNRRDAWSRGWLANRDRKAMKQEGL